MVKQGEMNTKLQEKLFIGVVGAPTNCDIEVSLPPPPLFVRFLRPCAPGRHVPRISPRRGTPTLEGAPRSPGGPLGD